MGMAMMDVWSGSWSDAVICLLADAYVERASELWRSVVRCEQLGLDAPVTCSDCGATDLEMWYEGQTWGATVCQMCYENHVSQGSARPPRPEEDAAGR